MMLQKNSSWTPARPAPVQSEASVRTRCHGEDAEPEVIDDVFAVPSLELCSFEDMDYHGILIVSL